MENTATYQGRPLARPDEDLEDQGLAFDVTTLVGRRTLLRGLGAAVGGLGLAACSSAAGSGSDRSTTSEASPGEIPDETAGPYPGDGSNGPDVLEQSGIVRSDIRSSFGDSSGTAEGVPVRLELTLRDLAAGGPYEGAAVYVWHADREGRYSMYSAGVEDQNYLRGVQVADAEGVVRFTSVFPACYDGRWPHVHFEVYADVADTIDSTAAIATSQVALPEATCRQVYAQPGYEASVANLAGVSLATDGVFGDDSGKSQLATVTGSVRHGYRVRLGVGVDTRTTPAVGQAGQAGP